MVLKFPRLIPGLAAGFASCFVLFLAACGAPGWNEVCNARCDSILRCQYQSAAETSLCHSDCNNTKVTAADFDLQLAKDCKNSGDIRTQQLHCYDSVCLSSEDNFERAANSCLDKAQIMQCMKP